METVASLGSFKTFLDLVKRAKYEKVLENKEPITILAPTDMAFKKMPKGYIEYLKDPSNKDVLESTLKKWTFKSKMDYAKLKEMGLERKYCGIEIIYPDIKAKNGIIHALGKLDLN